MNAKKTLLVCSFVTVSAAALALAVTSGNGLFKLWTAFSVGFIGYHVLKTIRDV